MKLAHRSKRYKPAECGGGRNGKVKTVVIHSTESPADTAEGVANYLKTRPDGSAHVVVDNSNTFQLQVPSKTTCGAGGFNTGVYHIEQAGFAHWSRKQWLRQLPTVRRAAYEAARVTSRYDIPRRWLAPSEVGKKSGITSHLNVTLAGYPTTHTDPGKHYPRRTFMALVKLYHRRMKG